MAETSTIFGFMKYVSATDILSDFKKTVDSHFVNSLNRMEIFHSVKDYAFMASRACCKSSMMSCASSRPTEKRIKSGATPASFNCSSLI